MTLAERNAEARRLGMSYGKYMAKYHPVNAPKPEPEPDPEPTVVRCVVCGRALPKTRRRYCTESCKRRYWNQQTAAAKRRAAGNG